MTDTIDPQILKRYNIIKKIGQGAYGHVWKAKDLYTGKIIALKKIYDAFRNAQDAQRTYRQVKCFQILKHTNFIQLHAYHYPDKNKDVYLSMEFMESDLTTLLKFPSLNQTHKGYIFYQIVNAVHYLHSGNVIHRDLKPTNILINNLNQAKICDFGLVRCLSTKQDQQLILTQNIATKYYRAPQILLGSKFYGKPSDIWSLGCILIEMLSGVSGFKGQTSIDQLQKIIEYTGLPNLAKKSNYLTQTSIAILMSFTNTQKKLFKQLIQSNDKDLIDLVEGILKFDPNDRLTIDQIKNHRYFNKFRKFKDMKQYQKLVMSFDNKKLTVDQYKDILFQQAEPIQQHFNLLYKMKPIISFKEGFQSFYNNNQSQMKDLDYLKSPRLNKKITSDILFKSRSPNKTIQQIKPKQLESFTGKSIRKQFIYENYSTKSFKPYALKSKQCGLDFIKYDLKKQKQYLPAQKYFRKKQYSFATLEKKNLLLNPQ